MAEPLSSIWWKGCMILSSVVLYTSSRNISLLFTRIIQFKRVGLLKPKLARSIEYMVCDDT